MRIYDSRVGRFLTTDPRENEYPWQTTYANSPISILDFMGGGATETTPTTEDKVKQTDNSAPLISVIHNANKVEFEETPAFASLAFEKPIATVKSGGVSKGVNGIDINFSISNVKATDILQIIQTVVVTNDDNRNAEEAKQEGVWRSKDGKYLGFVDPPGGLFYYNSSVRRAQTTYSNGTGTKFFSDHPSQINRPEEAYTGTEFHTYIVVISTDNTTQIPGKIVWGANGTKMHPTETPKVTYDGLTALDRSIINADPKAAAQAVKYNLK